MAEFEIFINQSLVDKTLDNFDYNPFVIIDFESGEKRSKTEDLSSLNEEGLIDINHDNREYLKTGIELIEDEFIDSENPSEFSDQPHFLIETISRLSIRDNDNIINVLAERNDTIHLLEKADSISYVADFVAAYVIEHPFEFGNSSTEIVKEAESIFNRTDQYVFNNKVLGFGSFFKKVWTQTKNASRKILNFSLKIVKKIIGFGKPELLNLRLLQYGRPTIKLSNPIKIGRIDLKVNKLKVKVPYYIKFPWESIKYRYFTVTINDRIESTAAGDLLFSSENLKIFAHGRMESLKTEVTILGVSIKIGLTGIANRILEDKKFEIYDASSIAKPIQVKDLKYDIKNLQPIGLDNGLRLDIRIDVSKP